MKKTVMQYIQEVVAYIQEQTITSVLVKALEQILGAMM